MTNGETNLNTIFAGKHNGQARKTSMQTGKTSMQARETSMQARETSMQARHPPLQRFAAERSWRTHRQTCEYADMPPCINRYYSEGHATYGGDIPLRAVGQYFPGDEPGFRCKLTLEMCSDHPPDCPEWKKTKLTCPVCLEYGTRDTANSYREHTLITRDGAYYCSECYEKFPSDLAVAVAAITALRELQSAIN